MPYLLNLVYLMLLTLISPWLIYAALRRGKYREGWAAKLLGLVPVRPGRRKCIWLHAVSVGEVNLLTPLLGQLEREYPQWECVISTTTRTGYALARQKFAPRTVFYCPLDFSWAANTALRRVRPDLLVLAELELWPNLIRAARRRQVNVAVVNGRLSDRSARGYRKIRPLIAPLLRSLNLIAVQNPEYAQRFFQLGAPSETVQVTGSIKFDGVQIDRGNRVTRRLAALAGIDTQQDVVLLAGSTQPPEETLALETYRALQGTYPHLRLILVPRHAERFGEVATLLQHSGVPWQRRSSLDTQGADPQARVLLVDAMGELQAWWGTAQIAFVGGSLGGSRGGQNMIEPAAYGAAVSFGPHTHNFREQVALLLQREAAVVVRNGTELTAFVRRCLQDPGYAAELGRRAHQLVASQGGATLQTVRLLANLLQQHRQEDPGQQAPPKTAQDRLWA